jgi:hypothetical protein
LKAWAANKNFESPEVAMNSYLNLEKLIGHDKAGRTVTVPGEGASPEEMSAYLAKIGRPEKPDGYEMPVEGADPEFVKWARESFHEAGIPSKSAKTMVDKWQQFVAGKQAAAEQERQGRFASESDQLRREWGAAFEDKSAIVDKAVREFGLGPNELTALRDAWGPHKAMTFFEKIGSGLGESSFITGGGRTSGFSGAMTPDQARGEIKNLQKDSGFISKYVGGDSEAKRKMEQLHQWAYPGV